MIAELETLVQAALVAKAVAHKRWLALQDAEQRVIDAHNAFTEAHEREETARKAVDAFLRAYTGLEEAT